MGNELTPQDSTNELAQVIAQAGKQANAAAAASVFNEYRARRADNTLRRQSVTLRQFGEYLPADPDLSTPQGWRGVTWGLVDGFIKTLLMDGYAIGTINVKLSTLKTYAKLAAKAGTLDRQEYAMIRAIEGYSRKEAKRVDEKREDAGIDTRVSNEKSDPVVLSTEEIEQLKEQIDTSTPQGRRDAVLVGLMLDLGLRCGEVASLTVDAVDLNRGELTFYREKVDVDQTHRLNGLEAAMRSYLENDALAIGPLLRASRRGGKLTHAGLSKRAITQRVTDLGEQAGIEGLSAHDLRHTWATRAARRGTSLEALRDAGGWNSLAMPSRYVDAAKIANAGVQ